MSYGAIRWAAYDQTNYATQFCSINSQLASHHLMNPAAPMARSSLAMACSILPFFIHLLPPMNRSQKVVDGTIANLAAPFDALGDGLAEMKADEDA